MEFYFDLDSAVDFIFDQTENEKNNNIVTTVTYPLSDGKDDVIDNGQREVSEQKNAFNDTACNIRYDLIKFFISVLMGYSEEITNTEELTFPQKIAFTTLINKDIIKVVQ